MNDARLHGAIEDADGREHDLLRLRALLAAAARAVFRRSGWCPRGAVAQATLLVLL